MAISYFTGTLNPASTTLAQDIRLAIKSAVTQAIAAGKTQWAITDDGYTVASNIRTVFTNTAGFAFKVHHSTTLTNTTVGLTLAQSYTQATHTMTNIGFGGGTTTPAASGFSGVNLVNVDTQPTPHFASTWIATSTQSAWYASVEADYMIFSVKLTATTGMWFYVGKFTSVVGNPTLGTDTYPFALIGTGGSGTNPSVSLHAFSNGSISAAHYFALGAENRYYQSPAYGQAKDYYSLNPDKAKLSKVNVYRQSASPVVNAYLAGWKRGQLKDILYGDSTNATIGTTVAVDTKTYQYIGDTFWAAIN